VSSQPPTIAYFFTTFPRSTETFLQREVRAMQRRGARLRLYSFWGGGGEFEGLPVEAFPKWKLLALIWIIPWASVRHASVFWRLMRGLATRRPPSWINFWENMLGAGFAGVNHGRFRQEPPAWIHAAWGGAPATAAWILHRLNGHPYSVGAHAYDLYEHGGDWWLNEKLEDAAFVHTSTAMAALSLAERGVPAGKIQVIRRGLDVFPEFKPLRPNRVVLRVICVARLVEKKGLFQQLELYARARDAGLNFEVRILGDGPLRQALAARIAALRLNDRVRLLGHCSQPAVWRDLAWADVLVHTGIVAASGDRDGLPNVIPEAMSAGAVVITSPAAATTEAIAHRRTGFVASLDTPEAWLAAFREVSAGGEELERIRGEARHWVEENFDAHRNAARLHALFEAGIQSAPTGNLGPLA